jgi:hypothetical protein
MRIFGLLIGIMLFFSMGAFPQEQLTVLKTMDGGEFQVAGFSRGRWALGFVALPGCPACEQLIEWFGHATQAFPEVQFLLVAPEISPDLVGAVGTKFEVLLDLGALFGTRLRVERAPTVFLDVNGVYVGRLDWPFSEEELLRALAESLLIPIKFPNPKELLGQLAPDFSSLDLAGKEIALSGVPRPLLLVFLSLGCSSCWEVLPTLEALFEEVAVSLVVPVGEAGFSKADRERLKEFLEPGKGRPVTVLLAEGFSAFRIYKVAESPTYILIDKEGVVNWVSEGPMERQELWDAVCAALKGSSGSCTRK